LVLGAFYGMQSVVAGLSSPVPFPVLVLPFANFILDTMFTLFRRLIRREKWYQAHRSHFYQRMTDLGMTHGKVIPSNCSWVSLPCRRRGVHPGRSGGANRIDNFRGRWDSLHRNMGLG
jgi:UDP-N-acetylmuramyl pentapeptide phosphotransferase/UDP-N-acetylglucosamine-1-phosphate transferase